MLKKCPRCGKNNLEETKFCIYCNADMSDASCCAVQNTSQTTGAETIMATPVRLKSIFDLSPKEIDALDREFRTENPEVAKIREEYEKTGFFKKKKFYKEHKEEMDNATREEIKWYKSKGYDPGINEDEI